jgi:hypothetical protein
MSKNSSNGRSFTVFLIWSWGNGGRSIGGVGALYHPKRSSAKSPKIGEGGGDAIASRSGVDTGEYDGEGYTGDGEFLFNANRLIG